MAHNADNSPGDTPDHSDDEDHGTPSASKGKRRESTNSKDIDSRKEQNRIAQREFRQRKQQYIKSLEARLQLHESSRDEQLDSLRNGIRALIEENQRLRTLLAQVSSFIGEGIGGVLPQLGVDLPEFQDLIQRHSNEYILQKFDEHQASKGLGGSGSKPVDTNGPRPGGAKRKRPSDNPTPVVTPPAPSGPLAGNITYGLPDMLTTARGPPTASTSLQVFPPLQNAAPVPYPPGYAPGVSMAGAGNIYGASGLSPAEARMADAVRQSCSNPTDSFEDSEAQVQQLFALPTDNPKLQAIQLISYHMKNKREQPNYHLPPSLKPTSIQQSIPHSPFFDGIIFPTLRDRLILLKDQYDLPTLLNDLTDSSTIHDDDILSPEAWEFSERFLRKYWYAIDEPLVNVCNRWRRARGEPELTLKELVPENQNQPIF